jgi:PhnB protein
MPDPTGRPDARVMQGVIPYLVLRGRAGEAADFYTRAFAATDLGRMPMEGVPGRYMHVQVEINGGALMMTDHDMDRPQPDHGGPLPSGHLQLVTGDARMWFDRAVTAGCTVVEPLARQFWGDDWGLLRDPFGITWAILQPAEAAP